MTAKCGEFPALGTKRPAGAWENSSVTRPFAPESEPPAADESEASGDLRSLFVEILVDRPIALVGLMGAGKTSVGKRLAAVLKLPFYDADAEIERAAGRTVQEIFQTMGEAEFRRGERQVIARLLQEPPHILATGGGAFMDPRTRALMRDRAVSVWLRAELDTLMRRVERRDDRPLLKEGDPRAVMNRLIVERYPVYAEADVVVDTSTGPHAQAVEAVLRAVRPAFAQNRPGA
jgi:shikimate kinase